MRQEQFTSHNAEFDPMTIRLDYILFLLVVLIITPVRTSAESIEGVVRDDTGHKLVGAMLTLSRADGLYAETIYTNSRGRYRFTTEQTGISQLRARALNHADSISSVNLAGKDLAGQNFRLRTIRTSLELANNQTASAHFSKVKFDDPVAAGFFRIECLTCHQLGNTYTRMPRSQVRWTQIVDRMLGFYGIQDEAWTARYVDILSSAFDGGTPNVIQKEIVDPAIFSARITQWKLPQGVIAHDVEHHAADGKFYTVDQGSDSIYITDPVTNVTETFVIPDGGIPVGGKFLSVLGNPNPFGLTVSRGPHSLQEGPDGKFYTTDTVSGQIGVFDPSARTFTGHDIGGKAMYPHTLRFDSAGRVWFTIAVSNQVGRFDPASGEMIRIDLPVNSDRPAVPLYMPYGIDIHPKDGSVWYSSLMANRIGRIDPDTLEVQDFKPPLIGPRRMRFSKDGSLWIPAYGDSKLVRLNTENMEYTSYPLPTLSPGESETPYAVGIHPETQDVWITANMSDRVFRFIPGEERFISYPLPTRGIFLRDMVFTPEGDVCAASSMAAAPLAVEGGMQEIICIDPE
jgi:virginiamycin B lyase